MLARGLAAAAVIASASGAATWTEIAYPMGDAKHLVVTSPKVVSSAFPGGEVNLEYQLLYRTGDKFGAPALPPCCLSCTRHLHAWAACSLLVLLLVYSIFSTHTNHSHDFALAWAGAEYAAGVTTKVGTTDKYAMEWAADGDSKGTVSLNFRPE